jgi:long-chain fatty acid transport protein
MKSRPWTAACRASCVVGLIAFLFSLRCVAGAAWLSESGGPDMAMASAGRAAIATDATTIESNPAGMAALSGTAVSLIAMPMRMDLEFRGSDATPGSATNGQGTVPTLSAFAAQRHGRWAVGVGAYGNVGLGCDFGTEWSGRRVIEDAQLRSINLVPAVAYRLSDRLDIGASAGAQYADVQAGMAVGNDAIYYGPPLGLPDGQLRVEGHSWAPVENLGIAFQADTATRIGLAWTSGVSHSMSLDVSARAVHPMLAGMLQQQPSARLEFSLPQQFTLSATRQVSPDTSLAASIGWQQWSRFGHARLDLAGQDARMFDDGLSDTWSAAIGLRHRVDPRWTLATGVAYDSNPAPANGTMPIYFPMADQLRLAAGADYRFSDTLLLRVALSLIGQGKVRVAQDTSPVPLPGIPPVTGTINGSRVYVLGLTADYRP